MPKVLDCALEMSKGVSVTQLLVIPDVADTAGKVCVKGVVGVVHVMSKVGSPVLGALVYCTQ